MHDGHLQDSVGHRLLGIEPLNIHVEGLMGPIRGLLFGDSYEAPLVGIPLHPIQIRPVGSLFHWSLLSKDLP